jgi:hypothetical protein
MDRFAALLAVFFALAPDSAFAENRTFVITDPQDGYGVDQCLTTGASCGKLIANAYCQEKDFHHAASFRTVDASEATASIAAQATARAKPAVLVAIDCAR